MIEDTESVEAYRDRARTWIEANLEPKVPGRELTRAESLALQAKLFDAGFAGFAYPREYGGQGLTFAHQSAFFAEAADYYVPTTSNVSIGMLGPVLLDMASEELKEEHIPKILRAEEDFIQFLSEPGGGSDMAGATTRATRDGDTYVIYGSKIWSSGAATATHALCLCRTDGDVPKHRGLSLIIMPLIDTPGLTINPIHDFTASGSHFCQEFFDDVVVPVTNVVGEENEGWAAAQRILFHERNATVGLGHGIGLTDRRSAAAGTLARAQDMLQLAARRHNDPSVRYLAGRAYAVLAAHDMARQRVTVGQRTGDLVGQWASLLKLGNGILGPAMAELAMAIAGSNGVVWTDDEPGGDQGIAWLSSRGGSIGGGSNEMQRNIVTERLLGMPREHDPSRELPFNEIMRRRART